MNDHFMQQRRDTQPDPSLFEMRCRAERAEQENTRLRKEVEGLHDRMAMLREEVARRDEQVRKHAGEIRELRVQLRTARCA